LCGVRQEPLERAAAWHLGKPPKDPATGDRCVDVFTRPDESFGFEEFRRDAEDAGAWTPVSYFSGLRYPSKGEVLAEAARQGFGVRDAWCDLSVPQREITRSLKDARLEMPWRATGRDHMDTVVQHHIAPGLALGHLPQLPMVEIAEAFGAADWKDRSIDEAAEIEQLLAGLATAVTDPAQITSSLRRSGEWIDGNPMMQSWFEDDAVVRELVDSRPRLKPDMARRRVMEEVLSARREAWAERLVLLALWLHDSMEGTSRAELWQNCAVLAHELRGGTPTRVHARQCRVWRIARRN
jgi:hypothetical protein